MLKSYQSNSAGKVKSFNKWCQNYGVSDIVWGGAETVYRKKLNRKKK
jgi:hypothetical protein